MKKTGLVLGAFLFLGILGFGGEKNFSFLFTGGVTRLAPDDLNSFLRDYARYYNAFGSLTGATGPSADSKTLRISSELEFTLLVRAAPRVFLTFGSGFINAGLESEPLVQEYSDLERRLSRSDTIRAVPIRVGLLYTWPLSGRLSIGPHVSLDGYIASFRENGYEERKDLPSGNNATRDDWKIETHTFSWGSTVGLFLDVALSAKASFCLDGGYRRARLAGFHGTDIRFETGGPMRERAFRLFYYEFYADWMETGFRFLNLPLAIGSDYLDVVRDAVLDLSGPYLRAGVRVSL